MEQGRERTRSYPTRQEAEQEKQRRLELLAQGHAHEPFDLLPPHEKRELFAIHERAREKGYELWDVARLHERQLEQQRVPGIEIGKAVKRCLEDKEAEGVSPRSLQSLRSVLLRYSLVDEYDAHTFWPAKKTGRKPFTLAGLIDFIDNSNHDIDQPGGLVFVYNNYNESGGCSRESLESFTTISSEIYTQLKQHYQNVFAGWVAGEQIEEEVNW